MAAWKSGRIQRKVGMPAGGEPEVEFGEDALDENGPVVGAGLAEEADWRVPGGVWAVLHPAPVGLPGQEEPEGFAHGCGEVGDGGVGREDEVEGLEDGGGVGEVAVLGAGVRQVDFGEDLVDFECGWAFLEGNPLDLRDLEEWEEGLEGGGAFAVGAVVWVSGPVEADFWDLCVPPLT